MSKLFLSFVVALVVFASCKKENTAAEANVSSINCASTRISSAATVAASYSGTVIVPYNGGNGLYYPSGQAIESKGVSGLSATLQPGNASDTGSLIYHITGTPLTTGKAEFAITLGTQHCTFTIAVSPAGNTAPKAYASDDFFVPLPADSCILSGYGKDAENNIQSFTWRKLTGPPGEVIERLYSSTTLVRSLQLGEYAFEFTATDSYGLKGCDTVKVYVVQPGQNEMFFNNLTWGCPMGCYVLIEDFYAHIPSGKPFLVFLRESSSLPWQYVKPESQSTGIPDKYLYSKSHNSLYIYSADDVSGNVDVKIQY